MSDESMIPQKTFARKIASHYRDRIGAYIIPFDESGRIALVKTPRYLLLLGGEIEKGEDDTACIKREAIEECGLDVEVGELIAIGDKYAYLAQLGEHVHFVARCHMGKIKGKIQEPLEQNHTLVYMTPEEAMKKMFFSHQVWTVSVALDMMEEINKPTV